MSEFHIPMPQHSAQSISLRDYFAALAMQACPPSINDADSYYRHIATHAYRMADAMLKERTERRAAYEKYMAELVDRAVVTPKVSAADRIAELEGQLANLSNEVFQQQHSNLALKKTIAELKEFLQFISLASDSSASSKRECGEMARKALARVAT